MGFKCIDTSACDPKDDMKKERKKHKKHTVTHSTTYYQNKGDILYVSWIIQSYNFFKCNMVWSIVEKSMIVGSIVIHIIDLFHSFCWIWFIWGHASKLSCLNDG